MLLKCRLHHCRICIVRPDRFPPSMNAKTPRLLQCNALGQISLRKWACVGSAGSVSVRGLCPLSAVTWTTDNSPWRGLVCSTLCVEGRQSGPSRSSPTWSVKRRQGTNDGATASCLPTPEKRRWSAAARLQNRTPEDLAASVLCQFVRIPAPSRSAPARVVGLNR